MLSTFINLFAEDSKENARKHNMLDAMTSTNVRLYLSKKFPVVLRQILDTVRDFRRNYWKFSKGA